MEVFCNLLSTTVIVSGLALKIPQIIKVLQAGSTKGVSLGSVILEECAYSAMLTYHFASGYPLMTYLEYTVLVLQDLILLMLILHYTNQFGIKALAWFILYFTVYNCIAFRIFPDIIVNLTIKLVTPLSVFSKVTQIRSLYATKDAGQVSLMSFSIAAYGSTARIITTAFQTGDISVLINFLASSTLNYIIIGLIINYKKDKKEKTS